VHRRFETALIVALALVPALAALHSRSFFSPDETSYAQVAREMLETGDFVVPTIDGRPWLEKPPLVYWLLAGAFAVFGWGFPAAVLLNALLTAGTALLIAAYVRRRGPPRAAVFAAAAYLTMFLPLAAARSALTDPALTLATTGAIVIFLARGWPAAVASGALLGLGILAKGPVAPLVALPAIAAAALAGPRRELGRAAVAVAAAAAVALPWFVALAARGLWPEFAAVFFGRQVLSRAVDVWGVAAPWWFYLPALWLAVFPWGTEVAGAISDRWKSLAAGRWRDAGGLAEAAAVIVPLAALSLAVNKLPHYLLPVIPFLAVWLGRFADARLDRGAAGRIGPIAATAGAVVGAAALAALAIAAARSGVSVFLPRATPWVLAAAALAFAVLGLAAARGARRVAWGGLALLALALRLGLDASLLPFVDARTVERPLAAAVREDLPHGGIPIAHRWWRASFVAYGVRGWERTGTPAELAERLAAAARAGRAALVLARSDSEGEVRAAAWNAGGVARQTARVAGLGEIDGKVLEGVVFLADRHRGTARWFYDADRTLPGERGFDALEGNAWTPTFRWSVASRARLLVPVEPGSEDRVVIRAWGPPGAAARDVRLRLNGRPVATLSLGPLPRVFTVPLPAAVLGPSPQQLEFDVGVLVVPAATDPGSRDRRTLAFALDWIAVEPAPRQPADRR
jgi:4-amino-4-deoxy-L-arabinose transferase-like glycosyltransferase